MTPAEASAESLRKFWLAVKFALVREAGGLRPSVVDGFGEIDFSFLDEPDRDALHAAREQFLDAVDRPPDLFRVDPDAPADDPATDARRDEAWAALERIGTLLGITTGRYRDPQAFRLGYQIDRRLADRLPDWVRHDLTYYEVVGYGPNDPLLWISMVIPEDWEEWAPDTFRTRMADLRETLNRVTQAVDRDWWARLRPMTESDQHAETLGVAA